MSGGTVTKVRGAQVALLFVFTVLPLSWRGIQVTSYSGWPALGFAVAFLLAAGSERLWLALSCLVVGATLALSHSYEVAPWVAVLGSAAVVMPALFTRQMLAARTEGRLRLYEVDSARYHLVTALAAALCGLLTMLAAASVLDQRDTLLAGLVSFLAALTAQLAVLPLMIPSSGRRPAGGAAELWAQRALLVLVVLSTFWPSTRLAIAFVVFPMLGWAAVRATRRETHVQLFLVCTSAYVATYHGHGPFEGRLRGVSDELTPVLVYLFMGAACYMAVPLARSVEQMFAATAQATRAATTVERLLSSAGGTIFVATDALGRITHYNAGAEHTLGYAPDEVLGRSPAMFHTPREVARHATLLGVTPEYRTVLLEMARQGERRDWEFLCKDGTTRTVSLTVSEVTDPEGEVIAYIGAGEDITERLRAQEAVMHALNREHASVLRLEEVDRVKQELVSNVSHELRTPIASISGYSELLSDGSLGSLNQQQIDAMLRIERNTERLGLLVEDLLTLSRAESGELDLAHDDVDLRSVASDALDLLEEVLRVRELEVRRVLPEQPVLVLGDAHALERVVMNVMGNAIKFTPDGGSIELSVAGTRDDALLTVSDTGPGIPPEDQEHLFTRFYRAAPATEQAIQGTGLGLSIVDAIVTRHGGHVAIHSAPGTGTKVEIVLPRRPGPPNRPGTVTEDSTR